MITKIVINPEYEDFNSRAIINEYANRTSQHTQEAIECFIYKVVYTDEIEKFKEPIKKALEDGDTLAYFKLMKKMAKVAIKDYKTSL